MNKLLAMLLFTIGSSIFANPEHYGAPLTGQGVQMKLADFARSKDHDESKMFVVEGKVEKVCEKKGCWMAINDGTSSMMIRFKDYSFFVPLKLKDSKIRAEGVIQKIERSVADLRHFAKDGGAKQADIEKIVTPKTELEFLAYGVVKI